MAGDIGIGRLIERGAVRDATHIAVLPVFAGEKLLPGQKVELRGDKVFGFPNPTRNFIGVVDPFLNDIVNAGERVYLFLVPGTIQSLRHTWIHKDIPSDRLESEMCERDQEAHAILERFVEELGSTKEEVISRATDYVESGYYWSEGGRFEGQDVPDDFWDAFEIITGKRVSRDDRGSFFSCSC